MNKRILKVVLLKAHYVTYTGGSDRTKSKIFFRDLQTGITTLEVNIKKNFINLMTGLN